MFRPMRRFKQALSAEECLEVLKEEKRGTLALAGDEGYPYALPINYFYEVGFRPDLFPRSRGGSQDRCHPAL